MERPSRYAVRTASVLSAATAGRRPPLLPLAQGRRTSWGCGVHERAAGLHTPESLIDPKHAVARLLETGAAFVDA